ncbi:MAG: hypothetical protein ACRDRA_06115 [Pseudonocardiaceae bacterium]
MTAPDVTAFIAALPKVELHVHLIGAVPSLAEHPLPTLLAAGVPVTIATDDPGMFDTDLDGEYRLLHTAFGLGIAEIARTGARVAFCSPERRTALLAEIDAVTAAMAP